MGVSVLSLPCMGLRQVTEPFPKNPLAERPVPPDIVLRRRIHVALFLVPLFVATGLSRVQSGPVSSSLPSKESAVRDSSGESRNDGSAPTEGETSARPRTPPLPRWYDFAANLPRDVTDLAGLAVDTRSLPAIAGASALTAGLFAEDSRTNLFSRRVYSRSRAVSSASDFFVSVGDGRSSILLAGAMGAYGLITSDHRAVRSGSQILEALLATGAVVQTMKYMAGRESPAAATSERGTWRPFPSFASYDRHPSRYYSFPSGHIATTVASITVLMENYPEERWIGPAGFSVSGLVGAGLVNKGWHWYSDLPVGAMMGYTVGKIVSHSERRSGEGDGTEPTLSLAPVLNRRGDGLIVAMRW